MNLALESVCGAVASLSDDRHGSDEVSDAGDCDCQIGRRLTALAGCVVVSFRVSTYAVEPPLG